MLKVIGAAVLAMVAASPAFALDHVWSSLPAGAVPVGTDLRLNVLTIQAADPAVDLNGAGQLRKGFGDSMIDFFPVASEGFHLSAGSRLTSRAAYINVSKDERVAGLLYSPGRTGYRPSRRFTPAMTAGYSREVSKGLTFGAEAGAMIGHFDSGYYATVHPSRYGLNREGRGSLNQVARLTAAFRF